VQGERERERERERESVCVCEKVERDNGEAEDNAESDHNRGERKVRERGSVLAYMSGVGKMQRATRIGERGLNREETQS
jgi:hypothetical protein